jgi:hypothetical protein
MGVGLWVTLIAGGLTTAAILWSVLGWLDRQVGAPVMRERINKGSDKFFEGENRNLGAATLDNIVRLKFEDEARADDDGANSTRLFRSESSRRARVGRSSDSA